eukprot:11700905-Prorocentrum_lima.AAC.1
MDDVPSPQSSYPGATQAIDDVSHPQSSCPGVIPHGRFLGTCFLPMASSTVCFDLCRSRCSMGNA